MNNYDIYRQLYTLLEKNVFFGDGLTERKFVTLLAPGQFVSTALNPTSLDDRYSVYNLCNKTLDSTFLHRHLQSTISGLYGEILEFAALPIKNVDQDAIDKAIVVVEKLKPAYDKYKMMYDRIDNALNRAEQAYPRDEVEIVRLSRLREDALSDWVITGKKSQYEDAKGELNYLLSANPKTFWSKLRKDFDNALRQAPKGNFYVTYLSPAPHEWANAGWEQRKLKVRSVFNHEYSRSTNFSAGASGGWGLWSAGGSYEKSTQYVHTQSKITDLDITFEMLVVTIERPWLYNDLFDRRFWTWRKGVHEFVTLSDGGNLTAIPPIRPLGPRGMPILPDTFYLVRNVEMTGNWSDEEYKYYAEQIKAKVSCGFGPFSANGSYSESSTEKTYTGEFADGRLSIKQPQIFAVGATLLNRCPDPDRSLTWSSIPGEAPDFGDGVSPQELEAIQKAKEEEGKEFIKRRRRRELIGKIEMDLNKE